MIKIEYRQGLDFNNPKTLTFSSQVKTKTLTLEDGQNLVTPEIYEAFEDSDYFKSLVDAKILIVEKPLEKELLPDTNKKSKLPPIED